MPLNVELREGQREKDQKVLLDWYFHSDFSLWDHPGFFDSSPAGLLGPKLSQDE